MPSFIKPRTEKEELRTSLITAETMSQNMARPPPNYHQIMNLVDESCKEFNGELLVEILRNLPVKSLLRFKTVCKSWKLLIDSHVFIDIHLHRKNPEIDLYSLYCIEEYPSFYPSPVKYIVGACNGIVCLATSQSEEPLFLFNPSTREVREVYFLEENSDSWCCLGFCYLSKTQEYKIIAFMPQDDDDDYNVDMRVLTLGNSTSLRDVEDVIVPGVPIWNEKVTFGTSIFWIGFEREGTHSHILIWFDAIEERFSKMNVPPSPSSVEVTRRLDVVKDSVIMFVYPRSEATFFDIWKLIDNGANDKSWMKYRKVGPLETGVTMNPMNVWYGKGILCSKDVMGDFCYYDLETNKLKDYEATYPPLWLCEFVNYVESLVSINRFAPCRFLKKKGKEKRSGFWVSSVVE